MTGEDWSLIMFSYMKICGKGDTSMEIGMAGLFIAMFVVYNYLLLNLFIGACENFHCLATTEDSSRPSPNYH